ncbi:MAG TPA: DUF1501 domain-containing protein [Vicinamibacterales bacterium]|nr:DUF1501 domain-containing protein [Vicinamibacterales bacterium]
MKFTRREFIRDGVAAFTVGFAAPAFLSDLARAQGATGRSLVVLYLSGGNDALSMLVPYQDAAYHTRRPTQAVPAINVIQIGADRSGVVLGFHPRLVGLKQMFDAGHVRLIQRSGYPQSSRSHFTGTDIWNTASPASPTGSGWLGRYLDTLPSPVDPLAGWATVREVPRALIGRTVSVPAINNPAAYQFNSPNGIGAEQGFAREAMTRISSHLPTEKPHLSFVNATTQAALATLDRVGSVVNYQPSTGVVYPNNNALAQALRAVAGAMFRGLGTKVFWVQTGGYDTHASQNVNSANLGYANLMGTLDTALTAFYTDLKNQGLLQNTMIVVFSEFGRRISENVSGGTDHGAAGLMMTIGGSVQGGIHGTAANLQPGNPTLENNGGDVTWETDFRSVYASVIDSWLGADSVSILGGNFRNSGLTIV